MQKKLLLGIALVLGATAIIVLNYHTFKWSVNYVYEAPQQQAPVEKEPQLTHPQEVWMHVLEWCESRGYNEAVNPKDNDGTPSYGAFQFKPSTLDYYAEKYGVATTTLMDYQTQKAVVTQMILHRDDINWDQQFPACVKKHGWPPRP